jgi:hypothetical protein
VRRERIVFAAVAVLLIVVRSWTPLVLEGFFFDSDQAIVGLMALHLSQLRHFPLYYYGLNYLLGVQAWIIAVAFALFHPSVTMMRAPLVALNAVVGVWLIAEARRSAKLPTALAFIAALPFAMPTPAAGTYLVEAAGASIEPFVYVLLLWRTRRRPLVFGIVLAVGVLHREFTLYAIPALLLTLVIAGGIRPLMSLASARFVALAAAALALVWLVVDDLKLRLGGGSVALQAASLGGQLCGDTHDLVERGRTLLTTAVPILFGGWRMPLIAVRMDTPVSAGSTIVGIVVFVGLAAMIARSVWLMIVAGSTASADRDGQDFGIYLAAVGVCAAMAYPLSCSVVPMAPPLMRYLLLGLLLPVGVAITYFRRETVPLLRALAAAVFVAWAGFNLYDNVRVIRASKTTPPLSEHRALADYLIANRIRYAHAIYWDAYVIDFLTRERVIVASVDLVRIPEYQQEVQAHDKDAPDLVRFPCNGATRIASWCVQPP